MAVKSFTRGSSTYVCRCCGRNTRASRDRSEGDTQLCAQCYELAGYENMMNDNGGLEGSEKATVRDYFDELISKTSTEVARNAFTSLWDHVMDVPALPPHAKYVYPEGMSNADKKKFRAAARRKS